jgi:hypothetical protein
MDYGKILNSHSGVAEDSDLLGYDAVLNGQELPTFWRSLLPPSSG